MKEAKRNDGTWLEDKVTESLRQLEAKHGGFYYRFADSKAAQNIIQPTPADFLFGVGGSAYLLECKSSLDKTSFRQMTLRSAIRKSQLAYYRLWQRSGNQGFFIYAQVNTRHCEIWKWEQIREALDNKTRLKYDPFVEIHFDQLTHFLSDLRGPL